MGIAVPESPPQLPAAEHRAWRQLFRTFARTGLRADAAFWNSLGFFVCVEAILGDPWPSDRSRRWSAAEVAEHQANIEAMLTHAREVLSG